MLKLEVERRAEQFVERLPRKHAAQIIRRIEALRIDPYSGDSKLLKGISFYRADSGEYRIVYRVEGESLYVYLIGNATDEVYRRLRRLEG